MLPANKHLLPIVGIDIHIVNVPTPAGPVPMPIPQPFIGIMLDIIDYIPFLGSSININCLPRGCTFTNGMLGTKKHIPLPPGGTFLLPPIIGHNSFNFFGSKTVNAQHSPLSPSGYQVMSCNDAGIPLTLSPPPGKGFWPPIPSLYAPTSLTIPIPTASPVIVGGPYVADVAGMIRMLLMSYAFGCILKKAGQFLSEKFPNLTKKLKDINCKLFGEPVDIVTGSVIYKVTDFELPGPLPLKWERRWHSDSAYEGVLGHGTHLCYDLTLVTSYSKKTILVILPDGRPASFSLLLNDGDSFYNRAEKITLTKNGNGYKMQDHGNKYTYFFAEVVQHTFKPEKLVNQNGFAIHFLYNKSGKLIRLIDSVGRDVFISYDDSGRMAEVSATYESSQRKFVTYEYNESNDLVRITDALGKATQVRFVNHLMVEKTDRNGRTFYWEYEGKGIHAKCAHTWGENGLLENWATYKNGCTEVKNSIGETSLYYYNSLNLITKIIDPLGNASEYVYTEHLEIYREVDAEGNITGYTYDGNGNMKSKHLPDGASVVFVYNDDNQLMLIMDAQNQTTIYNYNDSKLLRSVIKPDGSFLSLEYNEKNLLAIVTNEQNELTKLFYDDDCNLSYVESPNGTTTKWSYDKWGHCIEIVNPDNKSQYIQYDELDRVINLRKFDSNTVKFKYDAYGKIILAEDKQYAIKFTYNALGSLLTREKCGTVFSFKYDTENRLACLRNEFNQAYTFKRNAKGEVIREIGFDGITRNYERDRTGKVIRTQRPGGKWTTYEYDKSGRLIRAEYSDGSWETYSYNRNGQTTEACNEYATLKIERDAMGRVTNETCGEDWVRSNYDSRGKRVRITSSLGANITHEYGKQGTIIKTAASINEGIEWSAERSYNAMGLETERRLPGDVQKMFEYDAAGNPIKEKVTVSERETLHRRYSWNVNYRLTNIVDELTKSIINYGYDEFGNLASAQYEDHEFDYKQPDVIGNVYKTKEREDRKYGPSGRLLEENGTIYKYDEEGNLINKEEKTGAQWQYEWKGNGMLRKVVRPDGRCICFEYDALGRRLSKSYDGDLTRWIWNGNVPLHEWSYKENEKPNPVINEWGEIALDKKEPVTNLISWIFDEGSFQPAAKIKDQNLYSIITDYLGTPIEMYDNEGQRIWKVDYDMRGKIRSAKTGNLSDCPFRFQGQYHDLETGLYYNRFRYYSAENGLYISQDPIRLNSGQPNFYTYVKNSNIQIDPLGLTEAECEAALQRLQDEQGANSHFYDRHGAQTTLAEQEARALTGRTPDGVAGRPVDSTRFLSHADELEAAQKALDYQRNFGTGVGNETFEFNMGRDVGEGYFARTSNYGTAENVRAFFRDGNLVTLFPTLR